MENTKRLKHTVTMFYRAGLTLAAVNREGISVASLAKAQGHSARIELVSRWEAEQMDKRLPSAFESQFPLPRL